MYDPQAHLQSAVSELHASVPSFSLSWLHAIPDDWSDQCEPFLDADIAGEAGVDDIRAGALQRASDQGSAIAAFLAEAIRPWDEYGDLGASIEWLENKVLNKGIWQAHCLLADLHSSWIEDQLERGNVVASPDQFFELAEMYAKVVRHCALYRANGQQPTLTFDADYRTGHEGDIRGLAKAFAYASCPDNPEGSGRAAIYLLMCALDVGAPRTEIERQLDLMCNMDIRSGTIPWRTLMPDRPARYRLLESLGYHVEDIVERLQNR